jgi:hypothetical protein
MNRRQLLFAVISSAVTAGLTVHSVARYADSVPVFLHDLYTRETELHNKRLPPDNDAFYALFSHEMRELMQAPRVPNPREPVGPILHALFGRGVLPGTQVILSGVRTVRDEDSIAMAEVSLTVRGRIRELTVILLRQDGAWRIHQIGYGGPDTLAGHYQNITGQQ